MRLAAIILITLSSVTLFSAHAFAEDLRSQDESLVETDQLEDDNLLAGSTFTCASGRGHVSEAFYLERYRTCEKHCAAICLQKGFKFVSVKGQLRTNSYRINCTCKN